MMADFDVHYDPITVISDPIDITLHGLDDVKANIKLSVEKPVNIESHVKAETTSEFKSDSKLSTTNDSKLSTTNDLQIVVEKPVELKTSASVDLQPVVFDQCLNLRIDDLPETCIRQPYNQKLAVSFLGIEWFGISLKGEWQTHVNQGKNKPFIAWGDSPESEGEIHTTRGAGLRIRI